jgi:hypothetical protein
MGFIVGAQYMYYSKSESEDSHHDKKSTDFKKWLEGEKYFQYATWEPSCN